MYKRSETKCSMGSSINYVLPINFHCVLHAKKRGGVNIACKNVYGISEIYMI